LCSENSLEYLSPGTRAEVVVDVLLGRVAAGAGGEPRGWGVGEGDVDLTTGLPKTHQGTGGWLASAQRLPVDLTFETASGPPRGVRYNARASVIFYTGEHPVFDALARLWNAGSGEGSFGWTDGRAAVPSRRLAA
jgi:multidrug resistance efflux pump